MESPEFIISLKNQINGYLDDPFLNKNERAITKTLLSLFEVLYWSVKQIEYEADSIYDSKKKLNMNLTINKISEIKDEIFKYLESNDYKKEEFYILDVNDFDDSFKFINSLINNFFFYFQKFEINSGLINIYYYLLHLIYYILLFLLKSKEKNVFQNKIIKFYIYHIIHFFRNDNNSPEFNFFFYEGAFKYFKENFNISTKFLFNLNCQIPNFRTDIIQILKDFYSELLSTKSNDNNDQRLKLIEDYSQIIKIFNEESFYEIKDKSSESKNGEDKNEFLEMIINISNKIIYCQNKLSEYNVSCETINSYLDKIKIMKEAIIKFNLENNHFILMEYNYQSLTNTKLILTKYLNLLELWEKYNKDLEKNHTSLFSKIINSQDFQKLYLTAMKSTYIHIFIKENNLEESYNIFMEKYANKIKYYILYVPLTQGIKSYLSTYFRIALNINSVEIIGILNEQAKEEMFKSYILIQLLQKSIHFLFLIKKQGKTILEARQPQNQKIRENYREIGVDLTLHLFGTEYITFISLEDSKLLIDLKSWEKNDTNFKVFDKVYLLEGNLIKEGKEINETGIKCNIFIDENNNLKDWKICTNAAIRYCF